MKFNKPLKASMALVTAMGCLSLPAQAAIILYEFNSDSAVVTNNELSGSGVTANDSVASLGSGFSTDRWRRAMSPDAARTLSLTVDIGATPIDFTALDFVDGIDSNNGSNQTYSVINLMATTTGSETPVLSQDTFTHTLVGGGDTSNGNSVTLSGLTNLTNVSVTFEFEVLYGTGVNGTGGSNNNRFAIIDDVQITGNVAQAVPEPTTTALLGLGGLALILRRRR
jgi:hypothetical protein